MKLFKFISLISLVLSEDFFEKNNDRKKFRHLCQAELVNAKIYSYDMPEDIKDRLNILLNGNPKYKIISSEDIDFDHRVFHSRLRPNNFQGGRNEKNVYSYNNNNDDNDDDDDDDEEYEGEDDNNKNVNDINDNTMDNDDNKYNSNPKENEHYTNPDKTNGSYNTTKSNDDKGEEGDNDNDDNDNDDNDSSKTNKPTSSTDFNLEDEENPRVITDVPFTYKVNCYDSDEFCDYLSENVKNAGEYLSSIFCIYETMNVEINILPFCEYMDIKSCESLTGLTNAPNFISLERDNSTYSYPQGLVKQLDVSHQIKKYAKNDFTLYFNTDNLKEHDNDNFLLVATHELIHGMGFYHLITTANSSFDLGYENPEDFIIPQPYIKSKYKTMKSNEYAVDGWIPFSIFDKFLVETEFPETYIHNEIEEFMDFEVVAKLRSSENVTNYFNRLMVSDSTKARSINLANSFKTKGAIGFKAYDGELITLQTFDDYEKISSISHINLPFDCNTSINCVISKDSMKDVDENYLMYFTIVNLSTQKLMERYSQNSPYGFIGQKIVKILKTIGWEERKNTDGKKPFDNLIFNKVYSQATPSKLYQSKIFIMVVGLASLGIQWWIL